MYTMLTKQGSFYCPVPVMGLTNDMANSLIANELRRLINTYSNRHRTRLKSDTLLSAVLCFLTTWEGGTLVFCIVILFLLEIAICVSCHCKSFTRALELFLTFCLLIPFCLIKIIISNKLKKAELIRPFAQVKESLSLLTSNITNFGWSRAMRGGPNNLFSKFSVWDHASSTNISVFRHKQWVTLPCNMLAVGDIFKLHGEQTFPGDAVQVQLIAFPYKSENSISPSIKPKLCIFPVVLPNAPRYTAGEIFCIHSTQEKVKAKPDQQHHMSQSQTYEKQEHSTINIAGLSNKLLDDVSSQNLIFHESLHACKPLAMATFQALSFPCTTLVSEFLSSTLNVDKSSSRKNNKFFEILLIVEHLLFRVLWVLLFVTVTLNLFWTYYKFLSQSTLPQKNTCFQVVYEVSLWSHLILFILCFVPLIHNFLVEITDVWGNARLQSLFQWLQDTRLPSGGSPCIEKPEETKSYWKNFHVMAKKNGNEFDGGSCGSFTSSSDSFGSVLDSNTDSRESHMSVSRLPLRNQFLELFVVLSQGLDGPSNLLHTLNSTTSVVFVDKKGILTDTHRTIQEICLPQDIQVNHSCNVSRNDLQDISMTCEKPPRVDSSKKKIQPQFSCHKLVLQNRIVLDVLPSDVARDGQKFENQSAAESVSDSLKPLITLMAITQLPLSPKQYEDFSNSHWLFAQSMQDIFQSECIFSEAYRECVCSLKSITNVSNTSLAQFVISRFFLVLQSRMPKYPIQEKQTCTKNVEQETQNPQVVLAAWLVKDTETGNLQMITKGEPYNILKRCSYYFDGTKVIPLTKSMRRSLLQIVDQWNGDGHECLAFCYRPLTFEQQYQCLHRLDEHSLFCINHQMYVSTSTGMCYQDSPSELQKNFSSIDEQQRRYTSFNLEASYSGKSQIKRLKRTSCKKWTNLSIFPGPRSSIGALPLVPSWNLACYSRVSNMKQKYHTEINNIEQTTAIRSRTGFYNYGNIWCDGESIQKKLYEQTMEITKNCQISNDTYPSYTTNIKEELNTTRAPLFMQHDKVLDDDSTGSYIHRLMGKKVFMGMVALKLSTPQELASRIQGFHEAGIRFVYMAREDDSKTRSVGSLLGLETDWNCLISLEPVAHRVVNAVGNVVVPSGIQSIRTHIEKIDNVPLQVSLFSRGTPMSMQEMIRILQENGEVVTCIGSASRSSNFTVFKQADCSISVFIDKPFFCKDCLGRRCIGFMNRHMFTPQTKECLMSAALCSLPCALHINISNFSQYDTKTLRFGQAPVNSPSDPRWLSELLYEAFKESRRLVKAIETALYFYSGINIGFIAPCLLLVCILCTPPFFRITTILCINFLSLLLISVTFLHCPAGDHIMKEFPLRNQDYEEKKKYVCQTCLTASIRFVPSSFICIFMLSDYFCSSIQLYASTFKFNNLSSDATRVFNQCLSLHRFDTFFGRWAPCIELLHDVSNIAPSSTLIPIYHTQVMGIFLILFFTCVISFTFVYRAQSVIRFNPLRNSWLNLTWIFIFLVFFFISSISLTVTQSWSFISIPRLSFWLLLCFWPICLITIDTFIKIQEKNKNIEKQKYLKLLFTTRLGMWSPK